MNLKATRGTLIAVSLSAATAAAGLLTGVLVWGVRRMNVGSAGGDRERYDVYYDLVRQSEALAGEPTGGD
jgi:hypothetical protein